MLSAPLSHDSGAALWDESLPLIAAQSGMIAIDMREAIQLVAVRMLTSLATLSIGRLRQRCCLGGVMLSALGFWRQLTGSVWHAGSTGREGRHHAAACRATGAPHALVYQHTATTADMAANSDPDAAARSRGLLSTFVQPTATPSAVQICSAVLCHWCRPFLMRNKGLSRSGLCMVQALVVSCACKRGMAHFSGLGCALDAHTDC